MAAWLAVKQGVPFLPAVLAGVAATALMGAVLAYPTVRVRGVYLAVITIAFGLVFENILKEWLSVTGGTQGLIGIPRGNVFGCVADAADLFLGRRGLPRLRVRRPVQHHPLALRPRDARHRAERERRACARHQPRGHAHARLRDLGRLRRARGRALHVPQPVRELRDVHVLPFDQLPADGDSRRHGLARRADHRHVDRSPMSRRSCRT